MSAEEESSAGVTVDDIDERRLNRRVYDYLCRLREVRRWISECLGESDEGVVKETELEANLSNGVLLARLSHFFAADVVPNSKIFDLDQKKYTLSGLQYRHTDNVMLWRRAMQSVRLPEIFIPETVDVYEGRNMKTIFCLYALAFHLHRLRKAPPLRNQAGVATFSPTDMATMKEQLKDSKLPEFGDVGGLLTEKKPQAAEDKVTAALAAIAAAVHNDDCPALLPALQNGDAALQFVEECLAAEYLSALKGVDLSSRTAVQSAIISVNNEWASSRLDSLLNSDTEMTASLLFQLLDLMQIEESFSAATLLYIKLLKEKRERQSGPLAHDQVRQAVQESNGVLEVRVAAEHGSCLDSLAALSLPSLALSPHHSNARLYHNKLQSAYKNAPTNFFLMREDLFALVSEFSQVEDEERKYLELSAASREGDDAAVAALLSETVGDSFLPESLPFYIRVISTTAETDLSYKRLVQVVEHVNSLVEIEKATANKLININKAAREGKSDAVSRNLRELREAEAFATGMEGWSDEDVWRPPLVGRYAERVMKELQPRGEKSDLSEREEYFHHEFLLGSIFVETKTRRWSSRPEDPLVKDYATLCDIQKWLSEENFAFDEYYTERADRVCRSQQAARRFLDRKREKARAREAVRQEEAARIIQNNFKKYQLKKDKRLLQQEGEPNLRLVRKFVTFLQDKDYDISEEVEIEKAKNRVTRLVVANQSLDCHLHELDEKIGLLIKNKINLEEVMAEKKKVSEEATRLASLHDSIRRRDQKQTTALENIFYHIQADSAILANWLDGERDFSGVAVVLPPIFGFLTERREEYLMSRLLCLLIERDISGCLNIDDFPGARRIPLVAALLKHPIFDSANESVCVAVKEELRFFFALENAKHETFNLDPVDIYTSMGRPAVDVDQALADGEVQKVLEESKSFLAEWSTRFCHRIVSHHKLPESVRYLLSFTSDSLFSRFPHSTPAQLQKVLAEFLFEVWLGASLADDRHWVVSTGRETPGDGIQKMNAVRRFIAFAVSNRGYGNSKWYLTSLNKEIHNIFEQFRAYTQQNLSSPSSLYDGLNEFTQFNAASHPVLSLQSSDASFIISTLRDHADTILASPSVPDTLSNALRMAIQTISVDTFEEGRTHLLHLHPIPNIHGGKISEEEMQLDEVFVRTKKHLVELLLAGCVGSSVSELLKKTPSAEAEDTHRRLFNHNPSYPSIEAKQKEIFSLLCQLEDARRVSSSDDYQIIVTEIANDIRLASERRKRRVIQRKSLDETEKRLTKQREELRERLGQYEVYLDTCLANLAKGTNSLSSRRASKDSVKSAAANGAVNTTVEKLFKKGILVDNRIDGSDNARRAAKWAVVVASSNRKGFFTISVNESKENLDELSFHFQDLLLAKSRGEKTYSPKNSLVFSVTELISYINRKFYGR